MDFTFFSFCAIYVLVLFKKGKRNKFKNDARARNWEHNVSHHRPESPTTNINGKYQTTQNSTLTVSGSGEVGSSLVVAIVVPLLVLVIIVTFGIAWWKKKEFRKWIRDFGNFHFMISITYNRLICIIYLNWTYRN